MIRARLRRWLQVARVSPEETHDLLVAFGEVCTNAVEHSRAQPGKQIHVRVELILGEIVRLSVRDFGQWRFRTHTTDRGRGLVLARKLTDSLAVQRYPDGTEVVLHRRLQASSTQRAAVS